jgi:hypothetical protein
MTLLHEWGASNLEVALWSATSNGHVEAMTLLRGWGAKDFETAGLKLSYCTFGI